MRGTIRGGVSRGHREGPNGRYVPRDVMLQSRLLREPVFMICYPSLDELLDWWAPDCWQLDVEWISDECRRIQLLDRDFRFTVWLAHLSLDHRWTLSPVAGPWQGTPIVVEKGVL